MDPRYFPHLAKIDLFKYSDDEERDEHGRWTAAEEDVNAAHRAMDEAVRDPKARGVGRLITQARRLLVSARDKAKTTHEHSIVGQAKGRLQTLRRRNPEFAYFFKEPDFFKGGPGSGAQEGHEFEGNQWVQLGSQSQIEGTSGARQAKGVEAYIKGKGLTRESIGTRLDGLMARAKDTEDPTHPGETVYEAGQHWYADAGKQTVDAMTPLGYKPDQAIAMVAACSPRCTWDQKAADGSIRYPNLEGAMRAAQIVKDNPDVEIKPGLKEELLASKSTISQAIGRLIPESGTYKFNDLNPRVAGVVLSRMGGIQVTPDNLGKAIAIARGASIDETLTGSKVRSFYTNLADPSRDNITTVDGWQAKAAFGDALSKDEREAFIGKPAAYSYVSSIVADRAGASKPPLLAHQYQAITWVQSRLEGSRRQRGK